jgi:predicted methyltransferase
MKSFSCLFILIALSACSHQYPKRNAALPGSLEMAVESDFRDPKNTDRDKYQHPLETLTFFGVKPDLTVVEVRPDDGYYTEILAPYLSEKGKLYLAVPRMPPHPPRVLIENEKKLQDILLRHESVQKNTRIIPFEPLNKRNNVQKESADVVLNFNNVHNFVAKGSEEESFQFFYEVLKPGGTLGIVQHRIHKGKKRVPRSGYLYEHEVINMARKAGFKLVKKSEINANPKDKANYPKGVWTLPPTYRLGNVDRDKYEDIGESDKMTLKFIKPAE